MLCSLLRLSCRKTFTFSGEKWVAKKNCKGKAKAANSNNNKRNWGARPGLDLILRRNGLIMRRNGFPVIINDVFLEDGECYGR